MTIQELEAFERKLNDEYADTSNAFKIEQIGAVANKFIADAERAMNAGDLEASKAALMAGPVLFRLQQAKAAAVAWEAVGAQQSAANRARLPGGGGTTSKVETPGNWLQKALITGNDSAGGYLSQAEQAKMVEPLLAAKTALLAIGARTFSTSAEAMEFPVEVTNPTISKPGEAQTTSASEPTYSKTRVGLTSLTARVSYGVELGQDAGIRNLVGDQVVRAMATEIDRFGFEGGGAVAGLKRWPGITTVPLHADGAVPANLDAFATAISALRAKNVNGLVVVMHPTLWGLIMKMKTLTSGSNESLLGNMAPGDDIVPKLFGCPVHFSAQMAVTESQGSSGAVCQSALVLDPSQVVIVKHMTSPTLLTDPYSSASDGVTTLHARYRVGVGVLNASAIYRLSGIKLS